MVESGQAMIPAYESVVIRERQEGVLHDFDSNPVGRKKRSNPRRSTRGRLYEICSSRVLGEVLGKLFR